MNYDADGNLRTDEDWKGNSGNGNGSNKDNAGGGNSGNGRVMEILLGTIGMEMATTERRKREE